jgi:hypothetical protein
MTFSTVMVRMSEMSASKPHTIVKCGVVRLGDHRAFAVIVSVAAVILWTILRS